MLSRKTVHTLIATRSLISRAARDRGDGPLPAWTPLKWEIMTEQGNYKINYEPLFGPLQLIDVAAATGQADHPWYNQTLIEVGGVLLRLGVFAGGEYHWHKHQEQDEFFYVIAGRLRIELDGHDPVELAPGVAFSVPRGMLHRPVALEPTQVLMIERAGVTVTGD